MDCEIHHRIYRDSFTHHSGNGAVANVELRGQKGITLGGLSSHLGMVLVL